MADWPCLPFFMWGHLTCYAQTCYVHSSHCCYVASPPRARGTVLFCAKASVPFLLCNWVFESVPDVPDSRLPDPLAV
eukprot:613872-Pelagomonas_calceolata.AAC.1